MRVGVLFLDVAVILGEGDLGVLGGHAHERRHPHPEQRPRPTPVNRQRDTRDVADPDGGRQRRRERLEMRDIARFVGIVVHAGGNGEPVAEPA